MRNEQGRYRICHETVAEYLTAIDSGNARRLLRQRRLRRALAAFALLLCLALGWFGYTAYVRPPVYNEQYAKDVLSYGLQSYNYAGTQYQKMRGCLDRDTENSSSHPRRKDAFQDRKSVV